MKLTQRKFSWTPAEIEASQQIALILWRICTYIEKLKIQLFRASNKTLAFSDFLFKVFYILKKNPTKQFRHYFQQFLLQGSVSHSTLFTIFNTFTLQGFEEVGAMNLHLANITG